MAKYQIKINEPCNENWDKMSPRERGRFCSNCKKIVIDFTNTSDLELARLIHKGENMCGRFKETQLNKDLILPQSNSFQRLSFLFGMASFLGFSSPIFSQKKILKTEIVEKSKNNTVTKIKNDSLIILKGTVSDIQGFLPGASIIIKGTRIGTESNRDGKFKLEFKESFLDKEIIIQITFLGYKVKELKINKQNYKSILKIKLEEDNSVLGGYGVIEKRNIFEKTLYFTKKIFTS